MIGKTFRRFLFLHLKRILGRYWDILVAFALALIAIVTVNTYTRMFQIDPKFCTLEDEIYQTILTANHQEWVDFYRKQFESIEIPKETLTIRTSYGRPYVINPGIWNSPDEPAEFFVVVETSFYERTFGEYGYIYSLGQQPFISLLRIQPMSENIYCYWLDTSVGRNPKE